MLEDAKQTSVDSMRRDAVSPEWELVLSFIKDAFRGVKCRNERAVLLCGEAMDDYAPDCVLDRIASLEERDDWKRIPVALIDNCDAALSFVGPEAFRFLIPAYMCAYIRYDISPDVPIILSFFDAADKELQEYIRTRYSLLTDAQKIAISAFMAQHRLEEMEMSDDADFFSCGLLPWEWDEYRHYNPQMSIKDYEELLVERHLSWLDDYRANTQG